MHRPLLVLDLDETLLHSREETLGRPADLRVFDYYTYARPHLPLFLAGAAERYELAVWTASTRDYAQQVIAGLFPAGLELAVVFSRKRCTPRRDHELGEEYYLKGLKKVRRRGYDLARVVMLDDTPRALARHRGNLLPVRAYYGEPDDDELPRTLDRLVRLLEFDNFRRVDKARLATTT